LPCENTRRERERGRERESIDAAVLLLESSEAEVENPKAANKPPNYCASSLAGTIKVDARADHAARDPMGMGVWPCMSMNPRREQKTLEGVVGRKSIARLGSGRSTPFLPAAHARPLMMMLRAGWLNSVLRLGLFRRQTPHNPCIETLPSLDCLGDRASYSALA